MIPIASWEMLEASAESGVISRECLATVFELPSTKAVDKATEIEVELDSTGLELDSAPELEVAVECDTELETV